MKSYRTLVNLPRIGQTPVTVEARSIYEAPPWSIERTNTGRRVTDATGRSLISVDGNDGHGVGSHDLTVDEAQWFATNIAQLPELMRRAATGGVP